MKGRGILQRIEALERGFAPAGEAEVMAFVDSVDDHELGRLIAWADKFNEGYIAASRDPFETPSIELWRSVKPLLEDMREHERPLIEALKNSPKPLTEAMALEIAGETLRPDLVEGFSAWIRGNDGANYLLEMNAGGRMRQLDAA